MRRKILPLIGFLCLTACVSVPKKAETVSGEAVHESGKSRERCVDWLTQGELTATKWELLLDELDAEPEAIRKQTVERLMLQLDQWSDDKRTIPRHWRPIDIKRRKEVFKLIRHIDPRRLNYKWYGFKLTQPMPYITTLSLRTTHHALDIAKNPKSFPALKHINFYAYGPTLDQSLSALLSSPIAKQLVTLNLRGYRVSDSTLKILVKYANNLTNLKHLYLRGYHNTDKTSKDTSTVDQLVATQFFNNLHSLSVESTRHMIAPLFKAIEQGKPLQNLHTLSLRRNGLSPEQVLLLTKSRKWIALKHLDLSGNRLKPDDFKAISQSNILQGLQSLNLRLTTLDDQGASWLGYSDVLKEVQHLDLSRTKLTDDGIWRLLGHHRLKSLRTLHLQANHRLTAKMATHLAKAKHLEKLEVLDLRWSAIGDEGLATLSKIPMSLHTLKLSRNKISANGVKAMAKAPWATSLKVLDLNYNKIGDEGVLALISTKAFLRVLRLNSNNIQDKGLNALLKSDMVRLIEVLTLSSNKWTHQGATALGNVKTMERLTALELRHTQLGKPENLERMANSPSTLHLHRVRMSFDNIDIGDKKDFQNLDSPEKIEKKQLSLGVKLANVPALGEKVIKSPYLSAAIRRAIDAEVQKSIRFLEDNPQAKEKIPTMLIIMATNYLKRLDDLNREKLPQHALPPKPQPRTKVKERLRFQRPPLPK